MTLNTVNTSANSPELQIDFSSDEMKTSLKEYEEYLKYEATSIDISNIGLPTCLYVVLITIGIVGNVINVTVFTRESMRSPLNFLLASIEAINILGFFTYIPYIVLVYKTSGHVSYAWALSEYINIFVISFAMNASNWLTVAISIFRVIAVSKPLASVKLCSKKRAVISLVTIIIVSLLISITLFYANGVKQFKVGVFNQSEAVPRIVNDVTSNNQSDTVLRTRGQPETGLQTIYQSETDLLLTNSSEEELELDNQTRNERQFHFNISEQTSKTDGTRKLLFETYWYVCVGDSKMASEEITTQIMSAVFLLQTTIPCLVTVISTIVLLVNLWRASGRRKGLRAGIAVQNRDSSRNERKVTIMLLVILVLYVLAIIPHAIVNAVLLVSPDNDIWFSYVMDLATSRIGLLFTNSITFFVYLSMSDKYRKAFKELTGHVGTRWDFRDKSGPLSECVTLETRDTKNGATKMW